MWRVDSLEKTLMLGGIWGQKKGTTEDEMVGWHHRLNGHGLGWTWVSWWWTGRPGMLRFMGSQRVGHDWATELKCTEWESVQMRRGKQRQCNIYSVHSRLELCLGRRHLRHAASKTELQAQVFIIWNSQVCNMTVKTYKGAFIWPFYTHIFNTKG